MKNKQLMIVTEDAAAAQSIEANVTGFDSDHIEAPVAALECFKAKVYHSVVVDLALPNNQALVLMEQIKSFRSETVLIVLTEKMGLTKILLSRAHGALDYLVKPCDDKQIQTVMTRVSDTLTHWDDVITATQNEKQSA